MSKQPMTPFEAIGGEQCIAILVDTFIPMSVNTLTYLPSSRMI